MTIHLLLNQYKDLILRGLTLIIYIFTCIYRANTAKMLFYYIADILKDTIKPYDGENSNKFQTVAEFDCRGVEPIDFEARVRI